MELEEDFDSDIVKCYYLNNKDLIEVCPFITTQSSSIFRFLVVKESINMSNGTKVRVCFA